MNEDRRRRLSTSLWFLLPALMFGWLLVRSAVEDAHKLPYSSLLEEVRAGRVSALELRTDEAIAQTTAGTTLTSERLPGVDEQPLVAAALEHHVVVTGHRDKSVWGIAFWLLVVPALGAATFIWLMRRSRRSAGIFGAGEARIVDQAQHSNVTFADIAGVDEARAELVEVVDFLKHPSRYVALGARIPKGVLLVGPPGTGKTLLAKAVAGESGVPFFSLPGSGFVELFVGVGAARMRSLFKKAAAQAPCIVFIDELDAVGKRRGPSALAGNDEREQTLDQLLAEMDGFEANTGVVLIAATNRPDVLDPALLRAGRFDRQVLVDRPDQLGREAILAVHVRHLKLAPDVDIRLVARRVPGMVGADLANLVNEAALAAARRHASEVGREDFEEAIDRALLGLAKRGRVISDGEKRRVACHESGHTLVARLVPSADPVHRVSIIPRSVGALGVTMQLPIHDRFLLTEAELDDRLSLLLAGRAAEELVFGEVSTGAEDDLSKATDIARLMVCRYGMSRDLGPVALGNPGGPRFLDELGAMRDFSEATAREIDGAIRKRVEAALAHTRDLLWPRRAALDRLTAALLERETLTREEVDAIVALPDDAPAPA